MPNHVHVLINPKVLLADILHGWKSYTSRWILAQNEVLNLKITNKQHFWMREYWNKFIRNDQHYKNVIRYIHQDPVKARLCKEASEWRLSSAYEGKSFID